jgi:murein DD-endopeptidase MepM/ murein hydrolase activator NlpD
MTVRHRSTGVVLLAVGLSLAVCWPAAAQLLPGGQQGQSGGAKPPPITLIPHPTTTTTSPPTTAPAPTTTTTAPGSTTTAPPPAPLPDSPTPADGGGDAAPTGLLARLIPADAQAAIDAIVRTPANNTASLAAGVQALVANGMDPAQAIKIGYGRFPVAGVAAWSDDWHYPRWTGLLFRFHEGCDVFAPIGTPVRAPVDGIARIKTNGLGGLTVSVFQPDGTFYYMAHLSGTAPNLVDGQPVTTGDIVGFVGNSGDAAGGPTHVHFGIYPQGGAAVPPKPFLDQAVADALATLPSLGVTPVAAPTRGLLATALVRDLSAGSPVGGSGAITAQTELLWASAVNPAGGGVQLAEARAAQAAASVDWTARAERQSALDTAWAASAARARALLAPLSSPVMVAAAETHRQGGPPPAAD